MLFPNLPQDDYEACDVEEDLGMDDTLKHEKSPTCDFPRVRPQPKRKTGVVNGVRPKEKVAGKVRREEYTGHPTSRRKSMKPSFREGRVREQQQTSHLIE